MNTYTNAKMPRFWWLNPWKHALRLRNAACALADLTDDLSVELKDTKAHAARCEDLLAVYGITLGKPKAKKKGARRG